MATQSVHDWQVPLPLTKTLLLDFPKNKYQRFPLYGSLLATLSTNVCILQDLEASLAASMAREKETMEQIAALEREKENLARELASYISKDSDKVNACCWSALSTNNTLWGWPHGILDWSENWVAKSQTSFLRRKYRLAIHSQSLNEEFAFTP